MKVKEAIRVLAKIDPEADFRLLVSGDDLTEFDKLRIVGSVNGTIENKLSYNLMIQHVKYKEVNNESETN